MKEEELQIIAKSIYKAVKKALGTAITEESKKKARAKNSKDAIDDVMDDNFVAEAKNKTPVKRTAQMEKSEKGVDKLRNFIKNKHK